ncbi:MAG: adenosylcobinamide-GDP ribazoletransferase [Nitratireductor sp.]|nr:adenosylcobinamide-GDP ribazoletransferase [Nitratireductor sp.]
MDILRDTLLALRFFTRLPLPETDSTIDGTGGDGTGGDAQARDLAGAARAFPLAGLVIGALIALVWTVAASLLPPLPAAGLAIGAGLLITGALHEDGFSDCADGLGGGGNRERALEIMRDSRIGAFGAAALIVSIGLRWTALAQLDLVMGAAALLIAHAVSRAAIVPAMALSRYARAQGLASTVATGTSRETLVLTLAIAALIALLFGGWAGLVAAAIATGCALAFLKRLEARLGGYTGDGLGAMQQIAEIAVLLVLAGFWG